MSIALYEGEINMVIHARGRAALRWRCRRSGIRMVLADVGPGIPDIELAMQEPAGPRRRTRSAASGFGAGMGLPNMKKYSDEMDIETETGGGHDGDDGRCTSRTQRFPGWEGG